MKAVKVTSKGQVTIPLERRRSLGTDEGAYLEVLKTDDEIRLRRIVPSRALGPDDPIWTLVGAGESGHQDISTEHDRTWRPRRSAGGASPRSPRRHDPGR